MVVAGGERRSITQAVESNGIVRSAETDGTGVTGETTLCDVVRGLGAEEESVTTEDGVGSERRSLKQKVQNIQGVGTRS